MLLGRVHSPFMNKTVYLVRHGESVDNAQPVFQSTDTPLSRKGTEQAKACVARFQNKPFETLIASPIPRAAQTASYFNVPIEYSDLFIERVKPLEIEGKSWTDEPANQLWRQWEESLYTPGMRASNSENFDDITKRAQQALLFLQERPEQIITVVTHGYFLRTMVALIVCGESIDPHVFKQFMERTSIDNSLITTINYSDGFEHDARWHLESLNA